MTTTGEIIAAHRAARGKLLKGFDECRGPSYATPEQTALLRSLSSPGAGFLLRVVAEDQGVVFETGCWMHGGPGDWATPRPCGCPVLDFLVDQPKDAQPETTTIKQGPVNIEEA